ncbi:MAG: chitobiase/beta-hexosaminidase C-terminal domain-containing protein, partial [Prevotella sp.]|nr:chitobiase/beta-hexosaminidase C-terminal domain-containing protein [Prevotella sp.]
MNKILRYSFISLLMMLCGTMFADDKTITGSQLTDYGKEGGVTVDGFTFIALKNGGGSDPTVNATAGDARLYAKNTLTIKSANGNMTKLVFNISTQGKKRLTSITSDIGTIATQAAEDETVTWTGDAAEVTFTVGEKAIYGSDGDTKAGQFDFDNVVITFSGEGGGETPVTPDPDPQPSTDGVTFDFDADANTLFGIEGSSSGSGSSYVADGEFNEDKTATVDGVSVTVTASETDASTRNRIWATAPKLRLYNGSLTVTAPADQNISKISFEGLSWNSSKKVMNFNATASVGDLVVSTESTDKTATWTGSASSIEFTIGSNTQIGKMVVTLGEGGSTPDEVAVPVISGTTEFEGSTTVTITCSDADNVIYYSTGGDFQTYEGPFTITETTTVKAYAEDVLGEVSKTVEKTFTKKEVPTGVEAANIAEFLALPDKTQNITLTLTNARVLAFGKNNVIVNDGTGGMDIYKLSGVTVKQGDILNGTVTGPRSDYNNVPELNAPTANTITVTEGTITATKTTVAAIADAELFTDLFKLENVEIVEDGGKYYVKDGDKQIQIYTNQLGIGSLAAGTFTIEGVVGTYKTDKQFWPTSMESTQPIEVVKAADIAALKALDKGKEAELTLTNAQVLYAWKSSNGNIQAYVRDASGAMCFDFRGSFAAAGEKFETNKIVNGTIMVTNSVYNGLPQASAYADTNDENLTFADGSEAQAVSTTIPNVKNYICDLVEIEINEIVSDGAEKPKYYAKSGDDQIQIYNQFHVADYDDLSAFVGPASKIKGIAVIYQTASMEEPVYEIYPVADGIEQAAAEDAPELQAPEGWTKGISNGNLAGEDVKNYWAKEAPSTAIVGATIVDGAGKDGSRGIVVKSQDKVSQAWDTQFWIKVDEQLPAGTKIHVEFDYKADKAGSNGTQCHGEPGGYLHWAAIGNVAFTEEWQHFS